MPVKAAWVECDSCGDGTKLAKSFAVMRGGKILCEKCANDPHNRNEVYMWITPTANVTRTADPKKLDNYKEPLKR